MPPAPPARLPVLMQSALALLLGVIAFAAAAPAACAHALKASLAEATWREETHTLEITVRLFADDFEGALSAHAQRQVSLLEMPAAELDALIQSYLKKYLIVRRADGELAPLTWVGRELEDDRLLLHVSCELPGGLAGVHLRHGLLLDEFPEQINSLVLRSGDRKSTLLFQRSDGEQAPRLK